MANVNVKFVFSTLFIYFWALVAFLVPQVAIKPVPPAMELQSSNHWTAREFPKAPFTISLVHKRDLQTATPRNLLKMQSFGHT